MQSPPKVVREITPERHSTGHQRLPKYVLHTLSSRSEFTPYANPIPLSGESVVVVGDADEVKSGHGVSICGSPPGAPVSRDARIQIRRRYREVRT